MSDKDKKKLPQGPVVGDFNVRVVPAFGTSGVLDTPESRERALRKEDDARVAQHDGGEPAGEEGRALAEEAVDRSIEEARDRADGVGEMPILLRDPVTGVVIEK